MTICILDYAAKLSDCLFERLPLLCSKFPS